MREALDTCRVLKLAISANI